MESLYENLFDIVIPVGPLDIEQFKEQIKYTMLNVIGYRNIYLVSYDPKLSIDGCITIDERTFPFLLEDVSAYNTINTNRNGWYIQQLLKLYAGMVIPGIMQRYLVIDSDVYFLKPIRFVDQASGLCLYGKSYLENHIPYYEHMIRLHPSLYKLLNCSAICHHMMFETAYVKEMMHMIEEHHKDVFWRIFLKYVDYSVPGASEYELYLNYMLNYHPECLIIRDLIWDNVHAINHETTSGKDFVAYHNWCRK